MTWILTMPLIGQGLLILVDELYFHRQRGLPAWEIWGHPLDTLTVILPVALTIFWPLTTGSLIIFILLSLFSSLFVTKDEFVHAKVCSAGEHWLHSLLFVLHPLVFVAVFLLWLQGHGNALISAYLLLLVGYMLYQILYWGELWRYSKTNKIT